MKNKLHDGNDDAHNSEAEIGALSDVNGFVREHTDWMLAVAYRILVDRGHSEDAVQVAFTKVFSRFESFEGRSSLKSWMHRIVVNEALMILRKIKRINEDPIDNLLPNFDSAGCRAGFDLEAPPTPETTLSRNQTHSRIRAAIMKLPDSYRIVLCLRDIEGLSTSETSRAVGISEANVKIRLHRARAALKRLLETLVKDQEL